MEEVGPFNDLTNLAEIGELEPAYCRDVEILSTLEILARQEAKNVLLIGQKGVGKTRLVRGIAVAGVRGETVGLLEDFHIVELDMGTLLVGAESLRDKLPRLFHFLRKERGTILFVDNIHQIFDMENSTDLSKTILASMVRNALFRGEISCIATTTPEAFDEFLIDNKKFREHFELLEIQPMTSDATRKTLGKLRSQLEDHHKIEIPDDCLDAVVDYSDRFMPEKYFPGKAIELLDRACAKSNFESLTSAKAKSLTGEGGTKTKHARLSTRDIQVVVAELADVSQARLMLPDKWTHIEKRLRGLFIGQSFAISEILRTLKKMDTRRSDSMRPEAVFLFSGPRNSGKTLLASELARLCHGSDERLLRFKMKDFSPNQFAETLFSFQDISDVRKAGQIRTRSTVHSPSVVILFEAIEKAKPETFDFLLPIIQKGVYQDDLGRDLSLRNAIVIFATKEGAGGVTREKFDGFEREFIEGIRKNLRTEFADEIDTIVPFMPLSKKHIDEMVRKKVKQLRKEFKALNIGIAVHQEAYQYLSDSMDINSLGMTALFANLDDVLLEPVRKMVKDTRPKSGTVICVLLKQNELAFRPVQRVQHRKIKKGSD